MNFMPAHSLWGQLEPVFNFVVRTSLLGAAGVLLVLGIRACLGRWLSPAVRAWLWLVVAALCLSPRVPQMDWNTTPEAVPSRVREAFVPTPAPAVVVKGEGENLLQPEMETSRPLTPHAVTISLKQKLAFAWAAAGAGLLAFWLVAYAGMWRSVRTQAVPACPRLVRMLRACARDAGLRRVPDLVTSRAVNNPAVAGLWRPTVLMPAGMHETLEEDALRHVLLHECGHIRRLDLWLHWGSALLVAVHWFNLFFWLAARLFRADREAACDATVLGASAGDSRLSYGETLLALESRGPHATSPRLLAGILGGADLVRRRIVDIARYGRRSRSAACLAMAIVISGVCALALAAAEPSPSTPPAPSAAATTAPKSGNAQEIVVRTYKVPPDFIQRLEEMRGGDPVQASGVRPRMSAFDALKAAGVPFPEGSSAVFIPQTSQMIVANTTLHHDMIEAVVEAILKESARQFYVTTHLVVFKEGTKPALLNLGDMVPEKPVPPDGAADDGKGAPVIDVLSGQGVPMAVAGVYTDPQFQVVMRALAGKLPPSAKVQTPADGKSPPEAAFKLDDLASQVQAFIRMPSVTVRNRQQAVVQAVREFNFPRSYERQPAAKPGASDTMVPKEISMQPLGFVFEILPAIGPDGYTIDLTLAPKLPAFMGWTSIPLADGTKVSNPTFQTSNVTTSVSIWDGQTVAFGGEAYVSPFLMNGSLQGDEAFLAKKHPVMLFVTARMINPAGEPVTRTTPTADKKEMQPAGPQVAAIPFFLGPKQFTGADLIEIEEVRASSPRLEKGDKVVVKGRCRLDSRDAARLSLFLTHTGGDGRSTIDPAQRMEVKMGEASFELVTTVKADGGWLHVSLYPHEGGSSFGGVYFGTKEQMDKATAGMGAKR